MAAMTATRKFGATAVRFAVALICVGLATATHRTWPLFVAWLPLLSVAWVLTRPEPAPAGAAEEAAPGPAAEEA